MSEKLITLSNLATFKEQIENEIGSSTGLPDTTPVIALTSSSITLTFNEGVLPTHFKLSNGVIVDLQGNEYCAEGSETVSQSISSGKIVIVVNGDFSELASVTMTNLIWTLISNTTNFSFNDLPRFSDSSDVADFPGSSGGEGSGSGKLYEFRFNVTQYDMSGNEHEWDVGSFLGTTTTLTFSVSIYESNFEMFKQAMAFLSNAYNIQISCDTPQDFADYINSTFIETSAVSTNVAGLILCAIPIFADKVLVTNANQITAPYRVVGELHLFALSLGLVTSHSIEKITMADFDQQTSDEPLFGLNVNNSCTLTEYGTSASGGDTPSQSGLVTIELANVFPAPTYMYLTPTQFNSFCETASQIFGSTITKDNLPIIWQNITDYEKKSALMLLSFYTTFTSYDGQNVLKWNFDTTEMNGQQIATECYIVIPTVGDLIGSGNIYQLNCAKVSTDSGFSSSTITIY